MLSGSQTSGTHTLKTICPLQLSAPFRRVRRAKVNFVVRCRDAQFLDTLLEMLRGACRIGAGRERKERHMANRFLRCDDRCLGVVRLVGLCKRFFDPLINAWKRRQCTDEIQVLVHNACTATTMDLTTIHHQGDADMTIACAIMSGAMPTRHDIPINSRLTLSRKNNLCLRERSS
jgi:hypothetical protein